jgi:transmembrane sensor
MEVSRLSILFNGYFDDLLSEDEYAEFLALSRLPQSASELECLMEKKWTDYKSEAIIFDDTLRDKMLNVIYSGKKEIPNAVVPSPKIWQQLGIAAAVATVIFSAFLFYYNNRNSDNNLKIEFAKQNSIEPGSNKAVLVLANGSRISLTDAKNGKIASLPGITITKAKDGSVVYNIVEKDNDQVKAEVNTIETPRGGQYTINLPDGTSVTLNASSSLRFPSNFEKHLQRVVELTGEGYFEVAKDKTRPFIVKTLNQEVEVLGTHFNINAYPDETGTKTTLLEGAVKVNGATYLKEGQQSILISKSIQVSSVDTDAETAWKNGRLIFGGKNFKGIMRSIARWYDVEITYDYEPGDLHLSGGISRFENINDVLDLLQATGEVKFKVEGRRVIVIK